MNVFNIRPSTTTGADQTTSGNPIAKPTFARRLKKSGSRASAPATIIPMTLLAVSAALTTLPAHADVKEGQVEVSPFVGYHFFESDQNLDDDLTYGVRLSYSITPHWAVEGAVSWVNSSVDDNSIQGHDEGQFRSPMGDVDLMMYQLDALYHFRPDNKFSPYMVGGYGVTDYSPSISDDDMSTFNIGVGAKYWLAENLALRVEVRDHLVGEVFSESYHNISTTVGVSFAFGGKAKSKSSQAAKPAPAPEPTKKVVEAEVIVLELEDIHFDLEKATLTPEARRILQRSITTLQDNPKAKVRIAGYTSAAGTAEYNQGLSERRATAIKNYLVNRGGIATNRLAVIGFGDTRPGTHEPSPEDANSLAAKENMRALFEITVQ